MDSRLKPAGMTDDEKCRFQTNSSIGLCYGPATWQGLKKPPGVMGGWWL